MSERKPTCSTSKPFWKPRTYCRFGLRTPVTRLGLTSVLLAMKDACKCHSASFPINDLAVI